MPTQDLVDRVREKLDDRIEPYLVDDATIVEHLNWAQTVFAERTLCLPDATTFVFSFSSEQEWLDLDEQIIKVRQFVCSDGSTILPVSRASIDAGVITDDYGTRLTENWRTLTGSPIYAVTDMEPNRARLAPIPSSAGQGVIECWRMPEQMTLTGADPEVPSRWYPVLVSGALMQLYQNQDYELYDLRTAEQCEMRFERGLLEATVHYEKTRRGPSFIRYNRSSVW